MFYDLLATVTEGAGRNNSTNILARSGRPTGQGSSAQQRVELIQRRRGASDARGLLMATSAFKQGAGYAPAASGGMRVGALGLYGRRNFC